MADLGLQAIVILTDANLDTLHCAVCSYGIQQFYLELSYGNNLNSAGLRWLSLSTQSVQWITISLIMLHVPCTEPTHKALRWAVTFHSFTVLTRLCFPVRFRTIVSYYDYHNSGHYPFSCLLFKHTAFHRLDLVSVFRWNLTLMGPIDRANRYLWTAAIKNNK
jgi:hypothetical protein